MIRAAATSLPERHGIGSAYINARLVRIRRIDKHALTWHDHEMQTMSVPPKRLAGLLFLASLVTAQTGVPPRTVWDGVYTEAQAARGLIGLRPKLRGVSCALARR